MRGTLLFIAMLVGINAAIADGLEIKGIKLGMSLENFQALFPLTECSAWASEALESDTGCTVGGMPTFGGVRGDFSVFLKRGKITTVFVGVDSNDYGGVVAALKEKYGKPSLSVARKLQNGFGAIYVSHDYTWLGRNEMLVAEEYSENISQSSFRLRGYGNLKNKKEEEKKKAKDL